MSNLVKQCYIVSSGLGMRVINPNEYRAQETAAEPPVQEMPDEEGFSQGIEAETVEVSAEALSREMKEKAAAEADEILSAAKADADRILSDAKERADAAYEEQKRSGYEEGMEKRRLELEAWEQETREKLENEKKELQESYEARQKTMERDIVDAVIQVFDKVFGIQFEEKKQLLYHLVNGALTDTDVGDRLRIHVNRADEALLKEHADDIQKLVGNDVTVEFTADSKLADGACRLETAYGVIDCGVDTQLASLLKDIRSLV